VTLFNRKFVTDWPAVPDPGSLFTPWLIVAVELTLRTIALNSITTYSESASESLFVKLPTLNVTFVPLPNGPPLIAPPGRLNVGETLLLAPLITKPAPESVEEVMQLALPLHTKATLAVPSSMNCKPLGMLSVNCTFVNVPSASNVEMR